MELALRFSPSFNDFLYRNSSARDHDHFRVHYRIGAAAADPSPLKIGFVGSSITRDGIDARLFQERFPAAKFYNFGGSIKVPVYELTFLNDYAKAGVSVLVYPISAADIFKFRETGSAAGYYHWDGLMFSLGRLSRREIFEKRGEILLNLTGAASHAFRFKEVVTAALINSALGRPAGSQFDFYWDQQDIEDPVVLELKFRYGNRTKTYFKRKLREDGGAMEDIARLADEKGLKLVIYEMDSACPRINELAPKDLRWATDRFSELLRGLPAQRKNVSYFKAEPFECEDYAEVFHLNESGRRKMLERLSKIISPIVNVKGGA